MLSEAACVTGVIDRGAATSKTHNGLVGECVSMMKANMVVHQRICQLCVDKKEHDKWLHDAKPCKKKNEQFDKECACFACGKNK